MPQYGLTQEDRAPGPQSGPWEKYQQPQGVSPVGRVMNYEVTAPDGRKLRVTAPEGATQEQVLAYAQQNYAPQETNESARPGNWPQLDLSSMTRLQKIGIALRRADAAGNTEDARRLAQMYVAERDGGQATSQPIRVQGADGQQFEFPAGTSQEVMRTALAKHYGGQQRPTSNYSEDELFGKLERADAAGDTEAAKVIADEIRRLRGTASTAGAGDTLRGRSAAPANFSNVRSGYSTTEVPQVSGATYNGPLLEPSASAAGAAPAPSLETINARNRAFQGTPAAAERQRAYEQSQADAKRRDFLAQPAAMRAAIGAGSRVAAAGRGVAQMAAGVADAVDPRNQTVANLIAGAPASRYDEALAAEAQSRRDDAYMEGDTAATLGGIGGDLMFLAGPGAALKGLRGAAALAGNAGLGAGYSALQPVVEGESRGLNALVGGAFGAGAHGLASGVSSIGRRASQAIPSNVRQMAQRAGELGIPLHASQVSQSLPVKVAASAGKYLPFSGYGKAAGRQQEGINRAVAKTFGADAPKLTDDVMQRARQDLSREFEAIYNRNSVPIGANGARKLAAVENEAARRLTKDEAQVLRNQLDDILANADDGVLTGQKYQAVRTALRKAEGNDKLGMAVRELRQTLDDIAADAVGPQDSAGLKALRSKWANFRTAEAAMKQNSGAGGDVRLGALWPLIRKGSTKEMRELARMGQTVLKDPISDSGTAQRTLLYNLVMGTGSIANPALIPLIAKAAAGGATIGRAANSNALAKLLTRESRGVPTSKLGSLLQRANPYVAPAAAAEYNRAGGR